MTPFRPPEPRVRRVAEGEAPARTRSWSDPDTLQRAMGKPGGGPVLVLDDTGDDALALLAAGHAVLLWSPNPAGRALAALKGAAIDALPVQSLRALLGLDAAGRRIWFYHYLRPKLDPEQVAWWDAREPGIRAGIIEMGVLESIFARQRRSRLSPDAGAPGARGRLAAARLAHACTQAGFKLDGAALHDRLQAAAADHPDRCWIRSGHFGDLEQGPLYLRTEGHRSIRAAAPWTPVVGPPAAGLAGALVTAGLPPPEGALQAIAAALLPGAPLLVFGDTPPLTGLQADARQTQALRLADRGLLYPPPRLLRRTSPSAGPGASG